MKCLGVMLLHPNDLSDFPNGPSLLLSNLNYTHFFHETL